MIVYLDEIFLENVLIDYFLLLTAGKITGYPLCRKRLWLSAIVGGIYAIIAYCLPTVPYCRYFSIFVAITMGYIVFGRSGKRIILFVLLSAALRGVLQLLHIPNRLNMPLLIGSAGLFYLLLTSLFHRTSSAQNCLVPITVLLGSTKISLTAMVDTGNQLCDYAGNPVLIVSKKAVPNLINENCENIYETLVKQYPERNVILLSYHTISGSGMIPAIQSDHIIVDGEKLKRVYIGVTSADFPGTYQALWGGERRTTEIAATKKVLEKVTATVLPC